MPEQEITNDELARMIKEGFDAVDKQFDAVDKQFDAVGKQFDAIGKQFDAVGKRFDGVESDIKYLKSQMVTKEYLDDKLSDHHGDIVVLFRKEDKRFTELVSILVEKEVLSAHDVRRLDPLRPLVAIG